MAPNPNLEETDQNCPRCGSHQTYEDEHFRIQCKNCGFVGDTDGYSEEGSDESGFDLQDAIDSE